MGALTNKQAAFVREYLKDHNATQAAIRAGYSPKGADAQASRMLRFPQVSEAIHQLEAKATSKAVKSAQQLREYWSEKIDLHDDESLKSSEYLAKNLGMFAERHEHSGTITIELAGPYAEARE